MSVHSFFRRLARNDDSQLLPTVAVPLPSSPPPLHRPPKQPRSRPANIPLRDFSRSGTTTIPSPPLPLPLLSSHLLPPPLPLPLRDPDAFQVLAREEIHLRQSLQAAIDAQSEGLLAGFAASDAPATAASPASSKADVPSPTGRGRRPGIATSESISGRNGVVIPVRQPVSQRLGLQGARREISRAMAELEGLKAHEGELLEAALGAHEEDIATVEALGQKREGLEASIQAIEMEDSSRHVQDLCDEERSLDEEIRTLETKLAGMKTRHRHLRTEIERLDNRVQSQLSSYRAALALAEKETREFLARPPSSALAQTTTTTTRSLTSGGPKKGNQQSLWDLPAGRRTLPMAQEQFRDEQRMLLHRIAEVDDERTALEEGKHVWADVVQEVTDVEQLLRDEMQRLDQPTQPRGLPPETPSSATAIPTGVRAEAAASAGAGWGAGLGIAAAAAAGGGGGGGEVSAAAQSMHAILHHIDTARTRVEQHWRTSVSHKWGLLVCCVGAELEALVQGSAVLRATLGGDEGVGGAEGDEGLERESLNGHGNDLDVHRNGDRDSADRTSFPRERERERERERGREREREKQAEEDSRDENAPDDVYADADADADADEDDGPGADLLGF